MRFRSRCGRDAHLLQRVGDTQRDVFAPRRRDDLDPDRQTEWWPDTITFECVDGDLEQGCKVRNVQKRPWPMSPLYAYPKVLPWTVYAAPLGFLAACVAFWWAWKKGLRELVTPGKIPS